MKYKNKASIYIPTRKEETLHLLRLGNCKYYLLLESDSKKTTCKTNWILAAYTLEIVYMSSINKRLSLRVPANVIYRGLKDRRLERLFPEFFTGVARRLTTSNKANSELQFTTTTYDSQIQIKEIFKLKVLHSNATEIVYTTSTNITNDPVVESIVYTHIANILFALLMLETGYVNGLMERQT